MSDSKNFGIKVVFFFEKDINNDVIVTKIRMFSGEYYVFDALHQPIDRHELLSKKVNELQWRPDNTAELVYYLKDKTRKTYLNSLNEFIFSKKKLLKESDVRDVSGTYNSNDNYRNNPERSDNASNCSFNKVNDNVGSCSIHKVNDNVSNCSFHKVNKIQFDTLQPNATESKEVQAEDEDLQIFDSQKHDAIEFIEKFEKKFGKEPNKFLKFSNFVQPSEKASVIEASYSNFWNVFVENFLKKHTENNRKLVLKLDRSDFEIGGKVKLMDFIESKFKLYDDYLKDVPVIVQIKQIINSLPEEYAQKLWFNMDKTREDFLIRAQYLEKFSRNTDQEKATTSTSTAEQQVPVEDSEAPSDEAQNDEEEEDLDESSFSIQTNVKKESSSKQNIIEIIISDDEDEDEDYSFFQSEAEEEEDEKARIHKRLKLN